MGSTSNMVPVKPQSLKTRLRLGRAWLHDYRRSLLAPLLVLGCISISVAINIHRYLYGRYQYIFVLAGPAIIVAKSCSAIAEVCFGLILLPVSRGPMTFLRSTWVRNIIDFDEAINLHAWLGIIGITAALCHGSAATASYIRIASDIADEALSHDHLGVEQMLASWNYISGWVLVLLAVITFPFALRWPRQAAWMKNTRLGKVLNNTSYFWMTHHILILVFIPVLIMHSIRFTPGFYYSALERIQTTKLTYYIMVPLLLYMVQRLYRMARASHLALVLDAHVVGGDVLELKVLKPRKFHYIPGQFMYVCCPNVSSFEWHPFTITSAPQDEYVSVHIKRAGDWTGALHDLFKVAAGATRWQDNSLFGQALDRASQLPAPVSKLTTAPSTQAHAADTQQPQQAQQQQQLIVLPPDGSRPYNHAAGLRRSLSYVDRMNTELVSSVLNPLFVASKDAAYSRRTSTTGPAASRRASMPGYLGSRRTSIDLSVAIAPLGNAMAAITSASRRVTSVIGGAWDPAAADQVEYAREQLQAAMDRAAQKMQHNHLPPLSPAGSSLPEGVVPSINFREPTNAHQALPGAATATPVAAVQLPGCTEGSAITVVTINTPRLNEGGEAAKSKVEWQEQTVPEEGKEGQARDAAAPPPLLYLDGPFGAPTQDFKDYKVVLLVGTGIGITPMASVLRSLMHHLYDARCDGCGLLNRRLCRVRQSKVYVHWVSRNTSGMAWFEQLLASICQLDVDHLFELNVHLTGVKAPGGLPSRSIKAETAVGGSGGGVCLLPGCTAAAAAVAAAGRPLKPPQEVMYSYGRPDMAGALAQVHSAHEGETVGVFYCGPRALGEQMEKACRHLNITSEARFEDMLDSMLEEGGSMGKRPCRLQYHEEIF